MSLHPSTGRRRGFTLIEAAIAIVICGFVFVGWLKTMVNLQTARIQDRQVIAVTDYANEQVNLFQSGVRHQDRLPGDGRTTQESYANVVLPGGTVADTITQAVSNQGNHLVLTVTVNYELIGVGPTTMTLSGVRY